MNGQPPHACLVRAVALVNDRANAVGHQPGLNPGASVAGYLVGTDLRERELAEVGIALATDFFTNTLANLPDETDDPMDIIAALAELWRHGAITGAVAVAEARA